MPKPSTPEYTLDMIVEPTEEAPLDMAMIGRVTQKPDANASNNIRVAVRIRPPNKRELEGGASNVIVRKNGLKVVVGEPPDVCDFTYDVVLANCTQVEAFDAIGVHLVHSAYHGFNATCFAYGQTSSGKSFSMVGKLGGSTGIGEHTGITPRVATLLFDVARAADKSHEFLIESSFLEIYNEKVRDLLEPSTDPETLKIRESPQLGVHVTNLARRHVKNATEVMRTLITGFMNRTVSATTYNAESSRSHGVFELVVSQKYVEPASGETMAKQSKINLVDLAGSERSDKVGTTGAALVEGNNINKSLSVLGRCIKALVEVANKASKEPPPPEGGKKKKKGAAKGGQLVPFRESVLTWYLRESLAGNARTTMLAACSPVALNRDETMSTLRYAASAKNIKTAASKNEDPMEAKVRELAEEIQQLKAALAAAGGALPSRESAPAAAPATGGGADSVPGPDGARRDTPVPVAGMPVGANAEAYMGTLTDEEKEAYLADLTSTMERLLPGGFDRNSRSLSMEAEMLSGPAQTYPMLSCLNKDDMLSHAMTVPIIMPEDGGLFMIGRSGGAKENDFTLNGVGMQLRHAGIDLAKEGDPKHPMNSIQSHSAGAVVMVNGKTLPEGGEPQKLEHLDRITIGPCRMIAVWCEQALTSEQLNEWTYDRALQEMMHTEALQWTLLTPVRRRLLDKLKEAEMLHVEQANAISIDMCTPVRFHATVILGDGVKRLHEATATVDEVLSDEGSGLLGGEVLIVCTVRPPSSSSSDGGGAGGGGAGGAAADEKEEEAQRMLGANPNAESFVSDTDEGGGGAAGGEGSAEGGKEGSGGEPLRDGLGGRLASFGVHRGQSINMFNDVLNADDDEDDLMAGLKSKNGPSFVRVSAEGLGLPPEPDEDEDDDDEDLASSLVAPTSAVGTGSNITLFEMKLDKFEELCAELKATYHSISSLCQGVNDLRCEQEALEARAAAEAKKKKKSKRRRSPRAMAASGDGANGTNIVREIFDTICDNDEGTISRSDLSAAFNLFDETAIDPSFAERTMGELLPVHMTQLDFTSFTQFLVKFVQHQFYANLEPFVSNHALFVTLGGRDLSAVIAAEREAEAQLKAQNDDLSSKFSEATKYLEKTTHEVERLMKRLRQLDYEKNALEERALAAEEDAEALREKAKRSVFSTVTGSSSSAAAAAKAKKKHGSLDGEEDKDDEATAEAEAKKKKSKDGKSKSMFLFSKSPKKGDAAAAEAAAMAALEAKSEDGSVLNLPPGEGAEKKGEDESASDSESSSSSDGKGGDGKEGKAQVSVTPEEEEAAEALMAGDDPMGAWLGKKDVGLAHRRKDLEVLGVETLKDLLDLNMVGDDELKEAKFEDKEVERFNAQRTRLRACLHLGEGKQIRPFRAAKQKKHHPARASARLREADAPGGSGGAFAPASSFTGSGPSFDDSASDSGRSRASRSSSDLLTVGGPGWEQPPLSALLDAPVVILNFKSKRKLFAQAGKRPSMLETWAKGFGAGPELKTFKDNKWWLLPQGDGEQSSGGDLESGTFVILNAHSNRKLYAKGLKSGMKWEKEVGCFPAEDVSSETSWKVQQDKTTGAFTLQNAYSMRKLFARMPHRGEKWNAGVGAAPSDHATSEMLWHLVPCTGSSKDAREFGHVWALHLQQQATAGRPLSKRSLMSWSSSSSGSSSNLAPNPPGADSGGGGGGGGAGAGIGDGGGGGDGADEFLTELDKQQQAEKAAAAASEEGIGGENPRGPERRSSESKKIEHKEKKKKEKDSRRSSKTDGGADAERRSSSAQPERPPKAEALANTLRGDKPRTSTSAPPARPPAAAPADGGDGSAATAKKADKEKRKKKKSSTPSKSRPSSTGAKDAAPAAPDPPAAPEENIEV